MSVGLLIITHNRIGADILATAADILNGIPMNNRAIDIKPDSDYDEILERARHEVKELDSGDGVLVLTDIFGATPSNIATIAAKTGYCRVVTGINLPMLIRVLNYHSLPLDEIVAKATSAGHDSVVECDTGNQNTTR